MPDALAKVTVPPDPATAGPAKPGEADGPQRRPGDGRAIAAGHQALCAADTGGT